MVLGFKGSLGLKCCLEFLDSEFFRFNFKLLCFSSDWRGDSCTIIVSVSMSGRLNCCGVSLNWLSRFCFVSLPIDALVGGRGGSSEFTG